jgi:hypothetical protein
MSFVNFFLKKVELFRNKLIFNLKNISQMHNFFSKNGFSPSKRNIPYAQRLKKVSEKRLYGLNNSGYVVICHFGVNGQRQNRIS